MHIPSLMISQVRWLVLVSLLVSCARSHTSSDSPLDAGTDPAERDAGPWVFRDAGPVSPDASPLGDASPPIDAATPGDDAFVPDGPWTDVDCGYEPPPPFPPPDGPAEADGWWRWTGPSRRSLVRETKLAVDSDGRLHLAFVDEFDVLHATGVPGDWHRSELYTAVVGEEVHVRELSLVLTGEVPHLAYAPWALSAPVWAHRPCGSTSWQIASTPFVSTPDGVSQPGLAFDSSSGLLHAVGAVEGAETPTRSTRVGIVELPGGTPTDSDIRVWRWIAFAIGAVADQGYLHVSTRRMTSHWIYSRTPFGEWRSFEVPRGTQPRMVAHGDVLHVFAAPIVDPEEDESIRQVVHYRVDLSEWEITEEHLPLGQAPWFIGGAARGPDGEFHLVLSQDEYSVFHASDGGGDWSIEQLVTSSSPREYTYPSLAVGPDGRVWIAHVDVPADRLRLLSNVRD